MKLRENWCLIHHVVLETRGRLGISTISSMVKCGREGELSASACFCRIWLELIRADPGYGGSKVSNGKSSCRRLCILPGRCNKSKGHLIRLFFFGCFSTKHVNVSLGPAIPGVFKYSIELDKTLQLREEEGCPCL